MLRSYDRATHVDYDPVVVFCHPVAFRHTVRAAAEVESQENLQSFCFFRMSKRFFCEDCELAYVLIGGRFCSIGESTDGKQTRRKRKVSAMS